MAIGITALAVVLAVSGLTVWNGMKADEPERHLTEAQIAELREQYPQNYQPDMRLAYLLIDWQGAKPVGSRDYTQAQDYYLSAREKYQQAQANGQEDQNMVILQNLISQLEDTGWL